MRRPPHPVPPHGTKINGACKHGPCSAGVGLLQETQAKEHQRDRAMFHIGWNRSTTTPRTPQALALASCLYSTLVTVGKNTAETAGATRSVLLQFTRTTPPGHAGQEHAPKNLPQKIRYNAHMTLEQCRTACSSRFRKAGR